MNKEEVRYCFQPHIHFSKVQLFYALVSETKTYPGNTAFKLLEAKSPAINLTPVPELPKNNSFVGSL